MKNQAFALFFLLPLVGCDEKKPDATPPAAPKAAPAAPAAAAPVVPAAPEAAKPADPAAPAAAAAPTGAAPIAAAAPAGVPCEQAYDDMSAMIKAMEAKMGPGKTTGKFPEKPKFVEACKLLPAEAQQCMVMSYAMAHQKECQDAKAKLDPALNAKIAGMMKGG